MTISASTVREFEKWAETMKDGLNFCELLLAAFTAGQNAAAIECAKAVRNDYCFGAVSAIRGAYPDAFGEKK